MVVRSIDGEKLGKVFAVGDGEFHIEKGLFFPKDYLVRYSEISDIRTGKSSSTTARKPEHPVARRQPLRHDGGRRPGRWASVAPARARRQRHRDGLGSATRPGS